MPTDPPARPITIQGRRIPHRDEVRSLSLPLSGLPNIATSEPTPATTAKLPGACLMPTRESIFSASVTSNGEISSRMQPMNAAVYRAMKVQVTRCTATSSVMSVSTVGDHGHDGR